MTEACHPSIHSFIHSFIHSLTHLRSIQSLYDSRGLVRVGGRVIVYHLISLDDEDGGGC
jgi:hypothetical protein